MSGLEPGRSWGTLDGVRAARSWGRHLAVFGVAGGLKIGRAHV